MKRIESIFFNHKNLFIFYLIGILYIICPLQAFGNSGIQSIFQYCYIAWAVFLIAYDLLKRRFHFDKMLVVMVCFYVWCWITFILQPKGHGIVPLKHLLALLMFLALIFPMSKYYTEPEMIGFITTVFKMVVLMTTILNVLSIVYFLLHNTVTFPDFVVFRFNTFSERNGVPRYSGIYFHPVLAGEKCFLSIVFSFLLFKDKKISIPTLLLVLVSSSVMLVLGDPRTNYLQLLFVLAYAVCKWLVSKKGRKFALSFIGIAVIVVLVLFVVRRLSSGGGIAIGEQAVNQLSSNRIIIWKTAFTEFLKRPILGWGWENGDAVSAYTNANIENCHNIIVNLLLWTGLPGALLFLIMIVMWGETVIKKWALLEEKNYDWYAVITIALFIQSLLDILIIGEDIRVGTPFFWLLTGLTYYACKSRKYTEE